MPFSTILVGIPLFTTVAFFGRWIQLHPERVVMNGIFMSPHTFGARLFRAQAAIVGTLAVFGGAWCVVFALLSRLALVSLALGWTAQVVGVCAGVYAAVYVRKEVRARPEYVSNNPHGWWP
jgi:membrane associated rhomboid family serine protease